LCARIGGEKTFAIALLAFISSGKTVWEPLIRLIKKEQTVILTL
jgi:hypothetical protein